MMFLNTTCFSNLELSNVKLFDMTVFGTIGVGVVIGVTALIGFIIRMLFLYYICYQAPKDRPINTLIFYDQVNTFYLHSVPQIHPSAEFKNVEFLTCIFS